jgi:hypothetical protein
LCSCRNARRLGWEIETAVHNGRELRPLTIGEFVRDGPRQADIREAFDSYVLGYLGRSPFREIVEEPHPELAALAASLPG